MKKQKGVVDKYSSIDKLKQEVSGVNNERKRTKETLVNVPMLYLLGHNLHTPKQLNIQTQSICLHTT
jgi:hypothetical protein